QHEEEGARAEQVQTENHLPAAHREQGDAERRQAGDLADDLVKGVIAAVREEERGDREQHADEEVSWRPDRVVLAQRWKQHRWLEQRSGDEQQRGKQRSEHPDDDPELTVGDDRWCFWARLRHGGTPPVLGAREATPARKPRQCVLDKSWPNWPRA